MNVRAIGLSLLALTALSGSALAQSEYVSGFEHATLGGATLDPPVERRLPVRNLGSSGEDGVEIKLRTAFGGGAGVALSDFLATADATIKIRRKGWDGLIYGNHRVLSNGDGTGELTFDFSDLGATSLHVVEYDESGGVVSEEDFPGGVGAKPWVPNFTCPDGSQPILWIRYIKPCNSCDWILWIGWSCMGTGDVFTYEPGQSARMVVTPTFPAPAPFDPATESMMITAEGLTGFDVLNGDIQTFSGLNGLPPGVPWTEWSMHAVGSAHLDEECEDGYPCASSDRRLPVRNLGSSGEDGVEIKLNAKRATGVEVQLRTPCCPGHTTLLTVADDGGTQQHISTTVIDPLSNQTELDADFSDLGGWGWRLTLLDPSGVVVGPPGGTDIISGGPKPIFNDNCPPGSIAHYYNSGTTSNPVWVLWWCETINAFVLPGGTVVTNVATMMIEPLGATSLSGPISSVQLLGSEGEREIAAMSATYACPSDFNLDDFVTGEDFDGFVDAFVLGLPAADFDGNDFVTGEDFDGFTAAFIEGC